MNAGNRILYYPNEKIEFVLDDVNELNGEEIFRQIAYEFQNNYVLSVNGNLYKFIEIEFYYWSPEHQDPFVYGRERQKKMGLWCFHNSGFDLTIGSSDKIFGGILFRRLFDLETLKYLNGVWKIYDKVVSFFYNSINASVTLSIEKKLNEDHQQSFGLRRIGLNVTKPKQKLGNPELFINKKYRFIVDADAPNHIYAGRDEVRKFVKFNDPANCK